MNETEIRERVRRAFGDASVPPDLTQRVARRLDRPRRQSQSPLVGVVAALLALAIVGTLVLIRVQSPSRVSPAAPPVTPSITDANPVTAVVIPKYDLDQAQLGTSGALVTPLNLTSTDGGRTVTLIGAYADTSRLVLFLRSMPDDNSFPEVMVYDDTGLLNGSATGGRGIIGDKYFVLYTAPHPGSDGMAHMRVVINGFTPDIRGNWPFEFQLRIPASTHLRLSPPATDLGPWRFTIESLEVTRSFVHFQGVIDGPSSGDIQPNSISLQTPDGKSSLEVLTFGASALGAQSTRVDVEWRLPVLGDMYFLVIKGRNLGGAPIDGTTTPAYMKGGPPLVPTDYPAAAEALTFSGAFSATVVRGQPSSCGIGTGSSGTLFGLAIYFEVDQTWYWLDLSTDPRVRQYNGPGTYDVKAQISPKDGSTIFIGTVHLTVTSDSYPGPYRGSVRGTLTWTGAAASPQTLDVAGNWTCKPGGQLGPG